MTAGLFALADDAKSSVASLEAEILDVGGARFADPKSVESELGEPAAETLWLEIDEAAITAVR